MKDNAIIIKESENKFVILRREKIWNEYVLEPVVELKWAVERFRRENTDHEIMTAKELRKTNRHLYVIYEILKILEDTNDGNRGCPWLSKETFESLLYCFQDYSEWNLRYGQYENEQEKYEKL